MSKEAAQQSGQRFPVESSEHPQEWTVERLIGEIGWHPNGRDFKRLSDKINAALAEREHHKQEEIAGKELAKQLAAKQEKVKALVDALKKIKQITDLGMIDQLADDALAKVKEGK